MVYFVGAGAGDPELLTVKGKRLIDNADTIIYAGSLVNPAVLADRKPNCQVYDSAGMTLEEVLAVMQETEAQGKTTVRVHTGDASIYGAIREQLDALDKLGISHTVVPGVSSFLAAAAAMQKEYTLPDVTQTVILTRMEGRTPVPERERLEELYEDCDGRFAFIAGYTDGGAPYGVMWEEVGIDPGLPFEEK